MTRWLRPLAPLFVLVCAANLLADEPKKPAVESKNTDDYYPLAQGTTWHYKVGEKKVTAKVDSIETVEGVKVAKIVTMVDGAQVSEEQIAHKPEGIFRMSYGGEKADPPVMIWKAGAMPGDIWEVKTQLGTAGPTIEGKFKAGGDKIKVGGVDTECVTATGDFKLAGKDAKFIYWFAKDKGIVKLQMTVEGQDILMELDKFEPGK
jgi:hypothetical protein